MKKSIKALLVIAAIAASTFSVTARTSYRGFVSLDPIVSVAYSDVSPSEYSLFDKPVDPSVIISTTHGVQLNRSFFIGAGLGVVLSSNGGREYFNSSYTSALIPYIPFYVALRWDLNIARKVSPFISINAGYVFGIESLNDLVTIDNSDCNTDGGNSFYFQPTAGIRIKLHHHIGLNLGVTFTPLKCENVNASYSRYNLGLNIGLDF